MKHCNKCDQTKPLGEFYAHRRMRDGLSPWCKCCCKANSKRRVQMLKEDGTWHETSKLYRDRHRAKPGVKEQRAKDARKRYEENRHKILAQNRAYEIANRQISKKKAARRKHRFVSWADMEELNMVYRWAALASASSGVLHHVDHVIPLCGKSVSGLHVAGNLQVLPWWDNLSKSNKYEVDND